MGSGRASVVVAPTEYCATHRAEYPKNRAKDNQDRADYPKEADVGYRPNDETDDSEDDQGLPPLLGPVMDILLPVAIGVATG